MILTRRCITLRQRYCYKGEIDVSTDWTKLSNHVLLVGFRETFNLPTITIICSGIFVNPSAALGIIIIVRRIWQNHNSHNLAAHRNIYMHIMESATVYGCGNE